MSSEHQTSNDGFLNSVLVFLCVLAPILGFTTIFGGEREGTVTYSDCREEIELRESTLQKYYKKFTCELSKTESGKIMDGTCVHVDLGNSGNVCIRAFVYEKRPEVSCPKGHPYLGYDDKCYEDWESGRVNTDFDD